MAISNIPLFSMLRARMQWHQERQRLLAENVANADTPKFQPRDLAPLNFDRSQAANAQVGLATTRPAHIAATREPSQFNVARSHGFEVRPSGNAVNLEDQMLKVASNQMDYQAVTTLYTRGLGLIRSALGRSS
jgi:flagellar basal-body rod protein FlgB